MSKLSETVLALAATQLGVAEKPKGSNAGADVEKYLASVGLGKGYSWCMAFVYWCADSAAKQLNVVNPLQKTGGVLAQWNKTVPERRRKVPQAGDIFIMDFGKGTGHTGFATKMDGLNIHTIEGNTNDDGSREGYEVARRIRPIKSIKGFIRI